MNRFLPVVGTIALTLLGACLFTLVLVGGCMREQVTDNFRYSKAQRTWATFAPPYAGYLVIRHAIDRYNISDQARKDLDHCVNYVEQLGLEGDTADTTCECHILDRRNLKTCVNKALIHTYVRKQD